MLAAGLRVAFQQHFVAGVQKQHLAADAAAAQLADERRNGLDLVGPVARIEPHGGPRIDLIRAADRVGDEGLEQRRRNVVHAVEIDVLEQVQGHALAGAGQAANDDEAHATRSRHNGP